jgi:hypothetical protein
MEVSSVSHKPNYRYKQQPLRERDNRHTNKSKEHDLLLRKVYNNPELLQIEGLTNSSAVYKEMEPEPYGYPIIDLVIVYTYNGKCIILLAESKVGMIISMKRGDFQLHKAFTICLNPKCWQSLIRKILDSGKRLFLDAKVWIDTIAFYQEITAQGMKIIVTRPIAHRKKIRYLGHVRDALQVDKEILPVPKE